MGKELHASLRRPGRLLLVGTAGHNDVDDRGGLSYWQWMSDALAAAATVQQEPPSSDARVESRSRIGTSG
jgi:hypothetical protein